MKCVTYQMRLFLNLLDSWNISILETARKKCWARGGQITIDWFLCCRPIRFDSGLVASTCGMECKMLIKQTDTTLLNPCVMSLGAAIVCNLNTVCLDWQQIKSLTFLDGLKNACDKMLQVSWATFQIQICHTAAGLRGGGGLVSSTFWTDWWWENL